LNSLEGEAAGAGAWKGCGGGGGFAEKKFLKNKAFFRKRKNKVKPV